MLTWQLTALDVKEKKKWYFSITFLFDVRRYLSLYHEMFLAAFCRGNLRPRLESSKKGNLEKEVRKVGSRTLKYLSPNIGIFLE